MKLSAAFWNKQASAKTRINQSLIEQTRFVADYFNRVCAGLLNRFITLDSGLVLKTDLWNESVSTEREVLNYFSDVGQVGVDISGLVCQKAHTRNGSLLVSQSDIRNLPFKDGSFNVILDISTIDHVSESDAVKVIGEYRRLLCEGGVLFLLYAQKMPFARHYWNNAFEGVYLLDSQLIGGNVASALILVDDRGIDFLHSVFGLGPKRLFERFLIWHCPNFLRRLVVWFFFGLEGVLSGLLRGYCGLRLNVAVKRSSCHV